MQELFTIETAKQASHEGRIEQWIHGFLVTGRNPNYKLWEAIEKRTGMWIGPVEVPISSCMRCFEPEKDKVKQIIDAILADTDMPPLLVRYRWHQDGSKFLEIADGTHRHAAFTHLNHPSCWILLEIKTEHIE